MKTQIMNTKNLVLIITAVTSLTVSSQAHAGGRLCGWSIKESARTSTTTTKPTKSVLDEGTEEGLSAQDRSNLTDWALNTKLGLEDIMSKIQSLQMVEKKQMLVECIENAVVDSSPLASETLLRYTLNRALAANKAIEEEAIRKNLGAVAAGTIDQQVRLLRESVTMALGYYQNDIAYINGTKKSTDLRDLVAPEYAKFGVVYNDFLLKVSSSIYDATAQYKILRSSIGWLAKDLARDSKKEAFGRVAITLDNSYRSLEDPSSSTMADATAVIDSRVAKKALKDAKVQLDSVKKALGI